MTKTFALLILLLSAVPIAALESGYYDGIELKLAVDPETKIITGYYYSSTARGRFSCGFYLRGKLTGRTPVTIETWWPGFDAGEFIVGDLYELDESNVQIVLKEEHGGCWNVRHFVDEEMNSPLSLDQKTDWKFVRVISAKKAYFHSEPDKSTREKAYCVKDDAIGVSKSIDGWVHAEFEKTRGWIRKEDLFPDVAPLNGRTADGHYHRVRGNIIKGITSSEAGVRGRRTTSDL